MRSALRAAVRFVASHITRICLSVACRLGNYTWTIIRSPPDVTDVDLTSQTRVVGNDTIEQTSIVPLSPRFLGGWYSYEATIPFVMRTIRFNASFALPGTVGVDVNRDGLELMTHRVPSRKYDMAIGNGNLLHFDSAADGN